MGRHVGRTSDGTVRPTVIGAGSTLRSHTVVYAGTTIGDRFQTGHHVLVRENTTIGDDVSIGSLSVVEHTVTIGDKVRIHSQNFIPEFTVLEEGAWIGPRVTVTNAPVPASARSRPAAWSASTSAGTPASAPTSPCCPASASVPGP